jgi:hypothetical protein
VIANHAVIAFAHRAIAFFPQELPFFQIKPDLRLEQQGQDGQDETWQRHHSASFERFRPSSTRIEFSAHTTGAFPGAHQWLRRKEAREHALDRASKKLAPMEPRRLEPIINLR